ncbi:hypothetical protein MYCTH_2309805 [Thermothelomyces thermophilus ATCC 42464]|uniref:Aminotransferase class I/classII large domain-containing protein n=1 Tax=Thermothelomyces thermophilus (strain ATCC 42464 / BCRC 31852 / DSM 1799) TaxID=573729 RepID=G2QKQ6_THET4|nr:uncharacterized protein MYCTH_2309805 [Thermothelomyces thermophilus ATCC 42464]AEO60538.1 hypothetical protein MYCTH_2309805 [Thermothelomyces thermophilus ATCC 42464]
MATITNASTGGDGSSSSSSSSSNNNNNNNNVNNDISRGGTASDGGGLFKGVKLAQKKKLINLLRGWPAPSLLPAADLQEATNYVLSDPAIAVPVLQYGIDPGYQPLREEVARWLSELYPRYTPPGSPGSPPAEKGGGRGSDGSSSDGSGSGSGSGAGISADEITITGGASQSLACVLQSFTDPGYTRAVWVAAPCYFMACPIFEDNGFRGRLRALPEDEGGVDVRVLERRLKECEAEPWENRPLKNPYPDRKLYRHVIYLVATCANPSGKTMSLARREQLVHLAREYDALIISDDVYDLLQWPVTPLSSLPSPSASPSPSATGTGSGSGSESGSPFPVPRPPLLPLLSQIDAALPPSRHNPAGSGKVFSHAISNASFSKLVGPGVRTGWIHASADFAYGFSVTGTNRSGGAASQFAAAVVWRALASGRVARHVDSVVRPALRRRHALALDAIARFLAPLGVTVWGGNTVRGAGQGVGFFSRGDGGGSSSGGSSSGDSSSNSSSSSSGERGGEAEVGDGREEVYGGYFLWLTLPEGVDSAVVAERARAEEDLIVAPGQIFEVAGDEDSARFPRNLRLSYSWADEEDIVEGIERLATVLRRMLRGEGDDEARKEDAHGDAQVFK